MVLLIRAVRSEPKLNPDVHDDLAVFARSRPTSIFAAQTLHSPLATSSGG